MLVEEQVLSLIHAKIVLGQVYTLQGSNAKHAEERVDSILYGMI